MTQYTVLHPQHLAANGKMVDFAGWEMPIHYGSQLAEHHQVRQDAGIFDVSHMNPVDITGLEAKAYLRYLLANDVAKINPGRALYSCMLNAEGGIIDDLIVYQLAPESYRLVLNAGTRTKDIPWLEQQAKKFKVQVTPRADLAIIAVQGPNARTKLREVFTPDQAEASLTLKPFYTALVDDWLIAATGYTGEDGYEIILPASAAKSFWQACVANGIKPCGLGSRDTLRLEAGMNLYGTDMDESTTPLETGLNWTVAWEPQERDFIGRLALEKQRQAGVPRRQVGLILNERGVLRSHQTVKADTDGHGEITSGTFSPTLNCAIALARLPISANAPYAVDIRGRFLPVQIVKPPFVRHGQAVWKQWE